MREYRDSSDRAMSREEVHSLAREELGPRSGIPLRILPDRFSAVHCARPSSGFPHTAFPGAC